MYDTTDPRSALATAPKPAAARAADLPIAATQYVEMAHTAPSEVSPAGSPTWYVRGQNFVLAHTDLVAGDSLTRTGQEHEYVVVLTDPGTHVRIEADGATHDVGERAVVVVPPGDSTITALADTTVARLVDHRSSDVLEKAVNGAAYAEPDARVAPLVPWPEPVDGHRVRVYPIDSIPVEPGRFGRIFRTSAFMVNLLDLVEGPRDPEKLSPHHHDDFEQCSYAVEGTFVHHIRTPWGARRSRWAEDEHQEVGSPSVTVIPPPVVHTTEAVGAGRNQLIDIFCPPREDFSAQPGWVLNADEYPAP
ncbi:hypothetical protein [Cellulomonas fimi]|uniref:Uncharacterized protein n=1 Tax=Cellulomonas fimi TaxID=1708 RepID=A0A7Y0QIH5_CELFI|nr:hypothetical protein [Cellulomonas fimi]NMR21360.1 hypothetical protein [Cellulomonas fimi]